MAPPIAYATANVTLAVPGKNQVTATVVTSATATLRHNNMTGGSGPSGDIHPPGWGHGSCPIHHNRGHLIGNHLGGPGNVANNLVTLVSGTNHPFMFDYEKLVRAYVAATPAREPFTYLVECSYASSEYSATPGFPVPGAAGNPFCLFPAPGRLRLSLTDTHGTAVTLNELATASTQEFTSNYIQQLYTHMMVGEKMQLLNGVLKAYGSQAHITNDCWAVTHDPNVLLTAATNYANDLGY